MDTPSSLGFTINQIGHKKSHPLLANGSNKLND